MTPLSQRDLRLFAATLDGEARGEPPEGVAAVAQVILNRAFNRRWLWQAGALRGMGPIEATVLAKAGKYGQFSCWNGDRKALLKRYFVEGDPERGWLSDKTACYARATLRAFLSGHIEVRAGILPCTHYLNPEAVKRVPAWAVLWEQGERIGRHVFLRPALVMRADGTTEKPIKPVRPGVAAHGPAPKGRKRVVGGLLAFLGLEWLADPLAAMWDAVHRAAEGLGVDPRAALIAIAENITPQAALIAGAVVCLGVIAWRAYANGESHDGPENSEETGTADVASQQPAKGDRSGEDRSHVADGRAGRTTSGAAAGAVDHGGDGGRRGPAYQPVAWPEGWT